MAPCIHEAGHAVVAHLLGICIDCVLVTPEGAGETRLAEKGTIPLSPPDSDRREIQIALAGEIAETRYCEIVGLPETPGQHPRWGRDQDNHRAHMVSVKTVGGDYERAQELITDLRPRVEVEVERNWDQIVQLANDLYRDGNLSGPGLDRILGS